MPETITFGHVLMLLAALCRSARSGTARSGSSTAAISAARRNMPGPATAGATPSGALSSPSSVALGCHSLRDLAIA